MVRKRAILLSYLHAKLAPTTPEFLLSEKINADCSLHLFKNCMIVI